MGGTQTHHPHRTMQHESRDQILSAAIEQIRRDLQNGEVEALTVLLATVRPEWLESYLPEDAWPRPTARA